MNDSEFKEGGSGSDGTSRPPERTVPCTVVRQLAQECARSICDGASIEVMRVSEDGRMRFIEMAESEVAERIENILNANNETRREAGS
jgi:hypothetical protein